MSPTPEPNQAPAAPAPPEADGRVGAVAQLRAWLAIGSQSFGGGASTLYLMRQILIKRNGWLTDADFAQDWTLSKASPGLTLIGLTAILGRRIDGWRGLVLGLTGLLVPSVTLTIAMAAGFSSIRDQPLVQAAIRGMAPATIGLTLAMMTIFARTSMRPGRRERWIDGSIIAAALVGGFVVPDASVGVIVVGAVLGWIALGQAAPPPPPVVEPDPDAPADGRSD